MSDNGIDFTKPVGWETAEEWVLEQRAFNWNPNWDEEETRSLINDLWRQYCFAAEPKTGNGGIIEPAA